MTIRTNTRVSTPYGTWFFLALNVAIWLGSAAAEQYFGWRSGTVLDWGAKSNIDIRNGEYWRFFTPIFLHVSLMHLLVNSYALFNLGSSVESLFGTVRFVIIYLLSGICGVLLSFWVSPNPSAGASGALFGLLGAMLVYLLNNRTLYKSSWKSRIQSFGIVIALNLFISIMPGIDGWAHLGGMACGAFLGWWIGPRLIWQEGRAVDQNQLNGVGLGKALLACASVAGWLVISAMR